MAQISQWEHNTAKTKGRKKFRMAAEKKGAGRRISELQPQIMEKIKCLLCKAE